MMLIHSAVIGSERHFCGARVQCLGRWGDIHDTVLLTDDGRARVCMRNLLHVIEKSIDPAGDKSNGHPSGDSSNVFPGMGSIAGSHYDGTGGCFDDLPIQPKAKLPLQYLEYLVFVPMKMKGSCS